MGDPTVHSDLGAQRIELDSTSWVDTVRGFAQGADEVFDELVASVPWKAGRRWMYDREVDDPRLCRWYRRGDPMPSPILTQARSALCERYEAPFSGVGLNYYRTGEDSVAYHRDNELRDSARSIVAIVTLGAHRPFRVRPLGGGPSIDLSPASGDLIVMGGRCQLDWEHGVPKVTRQIGGRISASWRWSADGSHRTALDSSYFESRDWRDA